MSTAITNDVDTLIVVHPSHDMDHHIRTDMDRGVICKACGKAAWKYHEKGFTEPELGELCEKEIWWHWLCRKVGVY